MSAFTNVLKIRQAIKGAKKLDAASKKAMFIKMGVVVIGFAILVTISICSNSIFGGE